MEHDRQNFLLFWAIFCPFIPLTTQKIKTLKNFYKMSGDITILHMRAINNNHMIYGSWDIEHDEQNFLSFWAIFCRFTSLPMQKIIILHMFTIDENHMMYGSWDMVHDRQNFLSFWAISCPVTPPPILYMCIIMYHKWQLYDVWFVRYGTQQTNFFLILDLFLPFYPSNNRLSFYTCVQYMKIIWLFLRYRAWQTEFFAIGHFLHFYTCNDLKNQNFEKMKTPGDIIILDRYTKNYDYMMYGFWEMVRDRWTHRQTDRRKK